MRADVWCVVLSRDPRHAKSRLSPPLDEDERERLAVAMRDELIDAARAVCTHVVLVTDAPFAAPDLDVLFAPPLGTRDAALAGLRHVAARAAASALVLSADLPFVTRDDIAAVADASDADVVIVPDRHERGTNAIRLAPPLAIAPAFGPNSFAKHVQAATRSGRRWRVMRPSGIVFDLDTPEDLEAAREMASGLGSRAAELLAQGQTSRPSR